MNINREEEISPPAVAPAGGEHTSSKTRVKAVYVRSRVLGKIKGSNGKPDVYLCIRERSQKGKVDRVLFLRKTTDGRARHLTFPSLQPLTDGIKLLSDNGEFGA